MDHETALVNAFILPARRARFLKFLPNPKRRREVLNRLYHLRDLDPRFLVEIRPSDQNAEAIAALLQKRGAPAQCHVISTDSQLDGRELPLREVLNQIVGSGEGTLVSCIAGKLGYFEGESLNDRVILTKTTP